MKEKRGEKTKGRRTIPEYRERERSPRLPEFSLPSPESICPALSVRPLQKYDSELFKMAMLCLSAISGALPPDYVDTSPGATLVKQDSVDAQGNFDPKTVNTAK